MTIDTIVDIAREAVMIILRISAPMLISSMVVGLVISIFQTVTSIQEQTLTFVPKLIVTLLALVLTGGWILSTIIEFTQNLFSNFSHYIGIV